MAQPPSEGPPHRSTGPHGVPPPGGPQLPPEAQPHPSTGTEDPLGAAAPSAPSQHRGCAVATVSVLALAALVVMAGGVWGVMWLNGANGEYQTAPGCEVGQTSALDTLVSDYETEVDQPIEIPEKWRQGHQCHWITPQDGSNVPSAARMAVVHNAEPPGGDAEDEAAGALREAADAESQQPIDGIGDTALSWNETGSAFDWGCVGVQMANLAVLSCYTAAVDSQASESIPQDEAIDGAESLARETVQRIEDDF